MRRTSLAAGLLSLLLFIPGGVFAEGALEISDSVAGLSLNIDLYGLKPNTGYTVEVAAPDGRLQTVAAASDAQGSAQASLRGEKVTVAGLYTATLLHNGNSTGTQTSFTIYPDEPSVSASDLAADRTTLEADGEDDVAVAVHLTDRYGNGIPDRPIALIPSRTADSVVSVDSETDADGWQRFFVTTTQAGTLTLRAADLVSGRTLDDVLTLTATGGSGVGGDDDAPVFLAQLTGGDGIVDRFEVILPATLDSGIEAQTFTIRAVDRNSAVIPSYTNTVRFRSSDPLAELPGLDDTYKFIAKDQGQKTFALAVKFGTPGMQTITVEDSEDPSIKGSAAVNVTGTTPGGGGTITIESPAQGASVGGTSVTLRGTGPVLANLVSSGGTVVVRGATTQDGTFALTIPIATDKEDIALSVADDTGRFRSPVLRLKYDNKAPVIDLVSFEPAQPVSGEEVTVSLKTAATDVGTASVVTQSANNTRSSYPLSPMGSALYQGRFIAGAAGKYQVTGSATDLVGNTGSLIIPLGVRPLPPSNIRVVPKGQLMEVTWTASTSVVNGYRIYIGQQAGDWEFALDTRTSATPLTTNASVKDLDPGKAYTFAVSAVLEDLESDLSASAQQVALGLGLEVQPADGALVLRWNSLPQSIPITSYVLRFGLRRDALTEERILPATTKTGMESYVIADLINGVKYYLSLTPVAAQNPLIELTATAEGTPDGEGRIIPGTNVPRGGAPSNPFPPVTTDSGPAAWVWWAIGAGAVIIGLMQWSFRRRARLPIVPH